MRAYNRFLRWEQTFITNLNDTALRRRDGWRTVRTWKLTD
jgi:hypothetical protein